MAIPLIIPVLPELGGILGPAAAATAGGLLAWGGATWLNAPKCPVANGGNGPKHGATDHDDAINDKVNEVKDRGAEDIRKNQTQVDAQGNKVGDNKPDLQWTEDGQRFAEVWGRNDVRLQNQANKIIRNDPAIVVIINNIGK